MAFRAPGVGETVDLTEITAASIVTEAEGISSNDNDSTIPTSAAVKDYVDNNAGGGGGVTIYDATVGSSGADYTDISAAITGVGSTDINLLLITDITEDSDIAVPAGANLYINLQNNTLTMGDNSFTYTAAANVYIRGNGYESGAEIDYTATTSHRLFVNGSYTTSVTDIEGVLIDNNSSSANSDLSDGIIKLRRVKFNVPNLTGSGIKFEVDDGHLLDCWFVGAGTSTVNAISVTTGDRVNIENLKATGTWSSASYAFNFSTANVSNVYLEVDTNDINIYVGSISNVKTVGSNACNIWSIASSGFIDSIDCNGGDIDIAGSDFVTVSNVTNGGNLDLSDTGALNCKISNSRFATASNIGGDRHKLTNVEIIGGVTVNSGADNNSLVNCQVGADAGGGSNTITVASGSNNTRIIGCMTDAAISDAGTGTTTAGNVVY